MAYVIMEETVSNCVYKQNPTFRPFYLQDCGPEISWLNSVTVRVWVNTSEKGEQFKLLLDLEVSLSALQFIGTQVRVYDPHEP